MYHSLHERPTHFLEPSPWSDGYSHMTWMQYFSQRLQGEQSQTDHQLVDVKSTRAGDEVNMWPEERGSIIAAVTVLFLQKQWHLFIFCNMNDECSGIVLTLLMLMYFFLARWMITTKRTWWTCSVPQTMWSDLPHALNLIRPLHTVFGIMWLCLGWFPK